MRWDVWFKLCQDFGRSLVWCRGASEVEQKKMADQDVLEFQPNNTALESYVKEEKYTKQKTGTVFYEKYRKRHFFSHQRNLWPRTSEKSVNRHFHLGSKLAI